MEATVEHTPEMDLEANLALYEAYMYENQERLISFSRSGVSAEDVVKLMVAKTRWEMERERIGLGAFGFNPSHPRLISYLKSNAINVVGDMSMSFFHKENLFAYAHPWDLAKNISLAPTCKNEFVWYGHTRRLATPGTNFVKRATSLGTWQSVSNVSIYPEMGIFSGRDYFLGGEDQVERVGRGEKPQVIGVETKLLFYLDKWDEATQKKKTGRKGNKTEWHCSEFSLPHLEGTSEAEELVIWRLELRRDDE